MRTRACIDERCTGRSELRIATFRAAVLLTAVVMELLCLQPLQAQEQRTSAEALTADLPVLRSTTRDIQLDVVVTDRNGHTVRNLSESDFIVKENGVAQNAQLLQKPQTDELEQAPDQQHGVVAAQPGSSQKRLAGERQQTVILLDEVNVKFFDLAFARLRLDVFLASGKAADQPIALMALTGTKLVLVHPFTTDRAALRSSLRQLPPALPITANGAPDENQDFEDFTHAISALETIGRSLQGSTVRTNCIWITSGFLTMAKVVNSPVVQNNFDTIMQHTANLYLGARMSVYTIDPHGIPVESSLPYHDAQPRRPGPGQTLLDIDDGAEISRQTTNLSAQSDVINGFLNKLDERTGGRGYGNQNDIDIPLGKAIDDANASYLLAYAPTDRNFHGEYRHIQVELRTPGLHARTRDGYIAADGNRENSEAEVKEQLQRALESPLLYGGLQTSARLKPGGAKKPFVQLTVSPRNVEWLPGSDGAGGSVAQAVAIAAYANSGKVVYDRIYHVTTSRPDLQASSDLLYNLPLTGLPANVARLRVAVMDRHGSRIGTAEVERLASDP